MNNQDFIVVSVESQKGGVGKTTAALNLARLLQKSYEVLFLDLDIAGTEAEWATKSPFWSACTHLVHVPCIDTCGGKEAVAPSTNLVDMFDLYMLGDEVPEVNWRHEKTTTEPDTSNITLRYGAINVVSSHLQTVRSATSREARHCSYAPPVLFDTSHSQWFVDMLRDFIRNAARTLDGKRLAVVLDTSPGFSGLSPAMEEWLTDLGPRRAKVLLVNALDGPDVVACVRAIVRVEEVYGAKLAGMRAFNDTQAMSSGEAGDLSDEAERFFARLASTDCGEKVNRGERESTEVALDDLTFYRTTETKEVETDIATGGKWWALLFNRIPKEIITGKYEYNWAGVVDDCRQYGPSAERVAKECAGLFALHPIPYSDVFALQFMADRLREPTFAGERESRTTPRVRLTKLPEFRVEELHKGRHAPLDILDGAERILKYLRLAENAFREMVAQFGSEQSSEPEVFRVGWARFTPIWLYTALLRSGEPFRTTIGRHLSSSLDERLHRASEFLVGPSKDLAEKLLNWLEEVPPELKEADKSCGCLAGYILSSLLSAIAIKQATRKTVELTGREFAGHFGRAKRLVLMGCQVHIELGQQPGEGLGVEYWTRIARDEQLVRRAEYHLTRHRLPLFGNQRLFAGAPTKEYMTLARCELTLVGARDDAAVIAAAARAVARQPHDGGMAALVDRLLEETLTARALSSSGALSAFPQSGTSSAKASNPLRNLLEMAVMKEFEEALTPIVGETKWGLL
jgi:hypothetical protein